MSEVAFIQRADGADALSGNTIDKLFRGLLDPEFVVTFHQRLPRGFVSTQVACYLKFYHLSIQ